MPEKTPKIAVRTPRTAAASCHFAVCFSVAPGDDRSGSFVCFVGRCDTALAFMQWCFGHGSVQDRMSAPGQNAGSVSWRALSPPLDRTDPNSSSRVALVSSGKIICPGMPSYLDRSVGWPRAAQQPTSEAATAVALPDSLAVVDPTEWHRSGAVKRRDRLQINEPTSGAIEHRSAGRSTASSSARQRYVSGPSAICGGPPPNPVEGAARVAAWLPRLAPAACLRDTAPGADIGGWRLGGRHVAVRGLRWGMPRSSRWPEANADVGQRGRSHCRPSAGDAGAAWGGLGWTFGSVPGIWRTCSCRASSSARRRRCSSRSWMGWRRPSGGWRRTCSGCRRSAPPTHWGSWWPDSRPPSDHSSTPHPPDQPGCSCNPGTPALIKLRCPLHDHDRWAAQNQDQAALR
jgi:hypothetical protein